MFSSSETAVLSDPDFTGGCIMREGLKTYFNCIAKLMEARSRIARQATNAGDIGTNREVVKQEFFSKHLPKRLSANLGGDIFGIG